VITAFSVKVAKVYINIGYLWYRLWFNYMVY